MDTLALILTAQAVRKGSVAGRGARSADSRQGRGGFLAELGQSTGKFQAASNKVADMAGGRD